MDERNESDSGLPSQNLLRDFLIEIPSEVRIGGLNIEIVEMHGIEMMEEGRYGLYRPASQRIELCANISHGLKVQTLLHEIIHAIAFDRLLPLKEREVDQLANGLLSFILDNDLI